MDASNDLAIGLPTVSHALGDRRQSDASLAGLIRAQGKDAAYNIAAVYAQRSEADKASECLDKAVKTSDPGLSHVAADPELASCELRRSSWRPFIWM